MEQPPQARKWNASRIWLLALVAVAMLLLAPTFFAIRWLSKWRSASTASQAIESGIVASFRADYQPERPKAGWRYLWNANGPLGDTNNYVGLQWDGQRYVADDLRYPAPPPASYLRLSANGGHPGQGLSQARRSGTDYECAVIVAFAVPKGGPYSIRDSSLRRPDGNKGGDVHLRIFVNASETGPDVSCDSREPVTFDRDLGNLRAGDNIYVCVGPGEIDQYDAFGIDFSIALGTLEEGKSQSGTSSLRSSPAAGKFYPVALDSFYQRQLDSYGPNDAWGVVPQGVVEFDGIPFHMFGKIEMNGIGASRSQDFKPPRVGEIPVHRRAAHIHLIGGAGYKDPDGTPVAELRLHYANGEQRNIFINYGDHIRNWHVASDEKRTDVSDPRCHIVWNGTHPATGGPLRLFKNTFDNPLPAQEIRGLEVLSLFGNSFFTFCAVTLEEAAPDAQPSPLTAAEPDDSPYRREALVKVIDPATTQPIANAMLILMVEESGRQYGFGRYRSDARGQILLDYPPGKFSTVRLQLTAAGYLPVMEVRSDAEGLLPAELVIKCSPSGASGASPATGLQPLAPPGEK